MGLHKVVWAACVAFSLLFVSVVASNNTPAKKNRPQNKSPAGGKTGGDKTGGDKTGGDKARKHTSGQFSSVDTLDGKGYKRDLNVQIFSPRGALLATDRTRSTGSSSSQSSDRASSQSSGSASSQSSQSSRRTPLRPDDIGETTSFAGCDFDSKEGYCTVTFTLGQELGGKVDHVRGKVQKVHKKSGNVRGKVTLLVRKTNSPVFDALLCKNAVPKDCELKTKELKVVRQAADTFLMEIGEDTSVSNFEITIPGKKPKRVNVKTRGAKPQECEASQSDGDVEVTFSGDGKQYKRYVLQNEMLRQGALSYASTRRFGYVDKEGIRLFLSTLLIGQYYQFFCSNYKSISSQFEIEDGYKSEVYMDWKNGQYLFSMKVSKTRPDKGPSPRDLVSKHGSQALTKSQGVGSHTGVPTPTSNRPKRAITESGRELISSNGAKNVRDYPDSSSRTQCRLSTSIKCIVEFIGIPQKIRDLAVSATEISGHVDVENQRIQLFVQHAAALHSVACKNFDWTKFDQYCEVKTGDIKSVNIADEEQWWMILGNPFRSKGVVCYLLRENGICKTSFDRHMPPLPSRDAYYTSVDVKDKIIRLLVKTAGGGHAYECDAESYAGFELACNLETWEKSLRPLGHIAEQKPTKCKVVEDDEGCKAHFYIPTQRKPESVYARVYTKPKVVELFVKLFDGSQAVEFICEGGPEYCHWENNGPMVESELVEGTAEPTVDFSMIIGKWFVPNICILDINDTGECEAQFQFDKRLEAVVSGSVDAENELIKLVAKTGDPKNPGVHICTNPNLSELCGFDTNSAAKVTMKNLTRDSVAYAMTVGMAGLSHKQVVSRQMECKFVEDNPTEEDKPGDCQVEMELVRRATRSSGLKYRFTRLSGTRPKQDEQKAIRLNQAPAQDNLRGHVGYRFGVFVSLKSALVCRTSNPRYETVSNPVVYDDVENKCNVEHNDRAPVKVFEKEDKVFIRITVGKRKEV